MKLKRLSLLFIAVGILLTGCGTNKVQVLDCSISSKEEGLTINTNVKADFLKNEVKNINMDLDFIIGEEYLSITTIDAYKSSFDEQYKIYKVSGVELNVTNTDNTINVKINMDIDSMTDEDKETLSVTDTYGSISATKKSMETEGYTCKISR